MKAHSLMKNRPADFQKFSTILNDLRTQLTLERRANKNDESRNFSTQAKTYQPLLPHPGAAAAATPLFASSAPLRLFAPAPATTESVDIDRIKQVFNTAYAQLLTQPNKLLPPLVMIKIIVHITNYLKLKQFKNSESLIYGFEQLAIHISHTSSSVDIEQHEWLKTYIKNCDKHTCPNDETKVYIKAEVITCFAKSTIANQSTVANDRTANFQGFICNALDKLTALGASLHDCKDLFNTLATSGVKGFQVFSEAADSLNTTPVKRALL